MTTNLIGFWKSEESPIDNKKGKWYPVKNNVVKNKTRRKRANELYDAKGDEFYKSREWLRLRYSVIKKYGGECMSCGRSKKYDGVSIHVDHIKPRFKYPNLSLIFDNLQVLCDECNLGKSFLDETDWRPDSVNVERDLVYEAMKSQ